MAARCIEGLPEESAIHSKSYLDPGDEVICPDPSYPAYEAAIRMAGATPVPLKLEESKQFRFDLNELARAITPRTKMIAINSPQNPTGGVLTLDDLKGIADLARKHDLMILCDEIYSEIYYGDRPASILDVPNILDRVFLVNIDRILLTLPLVTAVTYIARALA